MKKCRVKVDAVTLVAAKDSIVIVSDKQFDLISHMVEEIGPKKVKKDESTLDETSKSDEVDDSIDKQEASKE